MKQLQEIRSLVFKIGARHHDNPVTLAELDQILGACGEIDTLNRDTLFDLNQQANQIVQLERTERELELQLEEATGSFDSVFAASMMAAVANTNSKLESVVSALGRLGAIVEADQQPEVVS